MAEEKEQVKDKDPVPECAKPTIEQAFQYAGSINKRVQELELWSEHIGYNVGRLQGESARRKRVQHDFTMVALGIYAGLVIAYIIVSN